MANNVTEKIYIDHIKIVNSNLDDNTYGFRSYIAGLIKSAGENARPALLDFSIIHIDKNGEESLLDLTEIPIVPPIFDPNPAPQPQEGSREKNDNAFLFHPRSQTEIRNNPKASGYRSAEDIKNAYAQLSPELREEYINGSADLIIAYILGRMANRYAQDRNNLDAEESHRIKDFQILKDENFDLDFFDLAVRTPGGFKEENGSLYLEVEENGKVIPVSLTSEEIDTYNAHKKQIKRCLSDGRFFVETLSDAVKAFEKNEKKKTDSAPAQLGE